MMPDGSLLVDSHCHLDHPDLYGELDQLLQAAGSAGIGNILSICTRISQLDTTIAIAERYSHVYFAAGLHPHYAGIDTPVTTAGLVELSQHPKMIGIGESGLDYHYSGDRRSEQIDSFKVHIAAARATGLPLIIHARNADKDMIEILSASHDDGPFQAVLHCYSSGPELAELAVERQMYISMSGICTFRGSETLRTLFRSIPLNRLLVETDAPYLAPHPYRGKRNQPAYVRETALCAAEFLGIGFEEFAQITTENFQRLFAKAVVNLA